MRQIDLLIFLASSNSEPFFYSSNTRKNKMDCGIDMFASMHRHKSKSVKGLIIESRWWVYGCSHCAFLSNFLHV
jgi:hypothetical protein